jgi:uncharacterized protein (TIGR00730 family)
VGQATMGGMTADLSAVCVFCGCNRGRDPRYERAAEEVGRLLADEGIRLVYGGGAVGLMGTVATAALAAGGTVIGILPHSIAEIEPPHDGLTELIMVDSMHERKAAMAERSDAFVALPGGLGTLEEVFETISWTQLGLQDKPTGFLNVAGFFDPLKAQLDRMVSDAFVRRQHRDVVYFDEHPARLLDLLRNFEPPGVAKWIDLDAEGSA